MTNYLRSLILSLSLSFAAPAFAADYYVAVTGANTNSGTQALPFATIQKCADVAKAGDTCNVTGGTYPEHVITKASGTSPSPSSCKSVLGSYPNFTALETPCAAQRITFKAIGDVAMQGFDLNHEFITIDGFTITGGSSQYFIRGNKSGTKGPGGNYCTIQNNEIVNGPSGTRGISLNSSGCAVRRNLLSNLNSIFLEFGGSYHLFEYNTLEQLNNQNFMFLFGNHQYIRRNLFRHGNSVAGGGTPHPDFVQVFGDNLGESYNMILEENWVQDLDAQLGQINSGGAPTGIIDTIHDWTFRRNVFANISLNMNIGMPGVRLENNTFYRMAYTQHGISNGGSLSRGEVSRGVLINNAFIEGGTLPNPKGDMGFYSFSGGALTKEVLRDFATKEPQSAGDVIAKAISNNLVSNGYLVNTNGALTAKAKSLTNISQFVLADTYASYKSAVFDVILRTVALDAKMRDSFVTDYNFVGAMTDNYAAKTTFTEPHGVNGGNPMLQGTFNSAAGNSGTIFTLTDALKPRPGSPLCGKGVGNTDIGAYSCDPTKVFSNQTTMPAFGGNSPTAPKNLVVSISK